MKMAEAVVKALSGPILVLDRSFRAVMANPAFYQTLNIAPGELEGKSAQELIQGEIGQAPVKAVLETVMAHDTDVQNIEIACTIPPNTRKVMAINAKRVILGEELAEMILVELRDVTCERETERRIQELNDALRQHGVELEEINKELDSFTHSASHDLRIPLRLANKIAHLMLQDHGAQLPAGAIEKINMILDSTREMGVLIEDLLAFSQVSREPMKKRRVDLRRLAQEVIEELAEERQGRDVNVIVEDLPPRQVDRALVKQVFLNLLANALKFTRRCDQAQIQVGCTQHNGETIYFVRDNGVGFDMSQSDAMFLVFHRLHKTIGFEGSGVGLALVKRIIERHNGRIWAEGTPDRGATFFFSLGD